MIRSRNKALAHAISFRSARCKRMLPPACVVALGLLAAAPAWSQYNGPASCATPPSSILASPNGGGGFYGNFAAPSVIANYAVPMTLATAATYSGDVNSSYFPVFYSLNNLAAWMASTGYCLELVVGGVFPDVRYFSVAVSDEHYALAQHIADADVDPENTGTTNPFTPNEPNTGNQSYLLPISFGAVPTYPAGTAGCGITPYEEDNLLDATQRHLSMDWNTNIQQPDVPDNSLDPHTVDTPTHLAHTFGNGLTAGPNGAGSIIVRGYLPPYSCGGTQGGSSFKCAPNPNVATPYLFFRDVATGCPYTLSYIESTLLNDPAASATAPETSAIVSASDPSQSVSGWLNTTQKQDHITAANITPQACYVNGDPTQSNPPSSGSPTFYNRVAWARAPQYNGQPGPDDSYVGGAISTTDLTNILDGSACGGASTQCIIRLRFQLPTMPNTCSEGTGCELSGGEQLRYLSLTFGQQQPADSGGIGDIDGVDPTGSAVAVSFVSMADSAFTVANGYVTLLVNVGKTSNLPSWLRLASGTGTVQGVAPGANSFYYYSAWTTASSHAGYNVVDMNGFTAMNNPNFPYPFSTIYPLLLTIRENLPASNFYCSGAVVPFSTAEYIGAGGLLGPYVPLVDYLNPDDQTGDAYSLPASPPSLTQLPLPSGSNCTTGVSLPLSRPSLNAPTVSQPLDWPSQSWPGGSRALNCGMSSADSPQIDFVATQFPTPVDDSFYSGSPSNCNTTFADNSCSQIIAQALQYTEMAGGGTWQPPVQITVQGSGFGYLPGLPAAIQGSASSPFAYLNIHNDDASQSHSTWDTNTNPNCQVYIANWTDSTISMVANLPTVADPSNNLLLLSPVSDVSPFTFMAASSSSGTGCPIAYTAPHGDNLTITVENPQSNLSTQTTTPVPVKSNATTTPY